MTGAKTPANPREALMRARAAVFAMLASVAELDAALQAALEIRLEGGIHDAWKTHRHRGLLELRQRPWARGNRDLVVRVSARNRTGLTACSAGCAAWTVLPESKSVSFSVLRDTLRGKRGPANPDPFSIHAEC